MNPKVLVLQALVNFLIIRKDVYSEVLAFGEIVISNVYIKMCLKV